MEQKKRLEELHREAVDKLDEYIKSKGTAVEEHREKITQAKDKWQLAWNEFLETLLILEKIEI
jgi:vacuolar-type H+-ATPase subunit H